MPEPTTTLKGPIHLMYDGGQVVVTPESQDLFVMASPQAVWACQSALAANRFWQQLMSDFFPALHEWCVKHQDRVAACYVPFPVSGECIKVFVVRKQQRFDFTLSSLISELELLLDAKNWPTDILQISGRTPDSLRGFFDPEKAFLVFDDAHSDRAPSEG